jgi:proline dehydrogenase
MTSNFFYNTEKAFALKNNNDLKRSLFLFRIINRPALVKMLSGLVQFAIRIGLPVKPFIKPTLFNHFCAGETLSESNVTVQKLYKANIKSILDYSVEGEESNENFDKTLEELMKVLSMAKDNSSIPYTSIKLTGLVSGIILEKLTENIPLSETETKDYNLFRGRMDQLMSKASEYKVPIYVDAEESWLQGAIDEITEEYMQHYNQNKAIVLTTLQMYRHDRLEYLQRLIKQCRERNIFLGIKLVRGAYIEKENKRAQETGSQSPIQPNKEKTDHDFNEAVKICLDNIDIIMLCAGTHNEESTLLLIEEMKKRNLPNNHPHIYSSQLFGMSDHISMNLAAENYNVTKYLPYGPVKAVIPYLMRRAEENTGIAGQMSRELNLLMQEKERREKLKLLN